jgi:hypothetical protein
MGTPPAERPMPLPSDCTCCLAGPGAPAGALRFAVGARPPVDRPPTEETSMS